MTQSPPGRRTRRARREDGRGSEQWLELPGWRRPLDTLLVLAVTFAAAWLALVVIPAAASGGATPVAEEADATEQHTDAPDADETTDPGQWMAGPAYTGPTALPTAALATEAEVIAAPAVHRAPATRAAQTTRAVPRTTAPRKATPTPTIAQAVASVTTSAPATTESAATSATLTSEPATSSSASETTSASSSTATSTSTSTSTETATTTSETPTTTAPAP